MPKRSAREMAEALGLERKSRHVLLCVLCEGGEEGFATLRAEVKRRGLGRDVHVSEAQCLGICEEGPTCVVYPDGTWYRSIDEDNAKELVRSHLDGDAEVSDLVIAHGPGTARPSVERDDERERGPRT